MSDIFSVHGKVVAITGAARGLGLTYAKGLLERGAVVALCDKMADRLETARVELADMGYDDLLMMPVDVTIRQEVDAFVDRVAERFGRLDCMINNAGVLLRRNPEEMLDNEWSFMMDVNVKGTFLGAQAAGRYMMKSGGGDIINVASIGAKVALDRRLGYCTTKAAVEHFTRVLAFEWGRHNIRVNAIAPGYIKSDMNADLRADPVKYKAMVDDVPLGRFGEPEDLVGTMVFLCSDASNFISGHTIYVDGGKTVH